MIYTPVTKVHLIDGHVFNGFPLAPLRILTCGTIARRALACPAVARADGKDPTLLKYNTICFKRGRKRSRHKKWVKILSRDVCTSLKRGRKKIPPQKMGQTIIPRCLTGGNIIPRCCHSKSQKTFAPAKYVPLVLRSFRQNELQFL